MPVSADLFEVLQRSKEIYERSGGAFDVTIAPVGRLWRRARRDRKLPDPARLAEARPLVGSDKMVLDPKARTVQLKKPGMKLDVGGIAKGYAAQAALDVLKKEGITRALVGGAGDIVVGDPPPGARGWKVAIAPVGTGQGRPHTRALARQRGRLDRGRRRALRRSSTAIAIRISSIRAPGWASKTAPASRSSRPTARLPTLSRRPFTFWVPSVDSSSSTKRRGLRRSSCV